MSEKKINNKLLNDTQFISWRAKRANINIIMAAGGGVSMVRSALARAAVFGWRRRGVVCVAWRAGCVCMRVVRVCVCACGTVRAVRTERQAAGRAAESDGSAD